MSTHILYSHSLDRLALDAVLKALRLGLDEAEYELALEALCELAAAFDRPPADLGSRLVAELELTLGLALDQDQYDCAVRALCKLLPFTPAPEPEYAPDAFLEMAYEDRVVSDYYD